MADISTHIQNIQEASRGEQVRDSIVAALLAINNKGGNAYQLDGHDVSYFATTEALHALQTSLLPMDTVPTSGSTKPVTSGALYDVLGDIMDALDDINGISV